jgi:hypothetical protein
VIVSEIWPPAASVAVVRRLMSWPGCVAKRAWQVPPEPVTVAGVQVLPPFTDTGTVTLAIFGVAASCR